MKKVFVSLVLLFVTAGCTAYSPNQIPNELFTMKSFNAPLNKTFEVETGENIFVEGTFIEGEIIKITQPLDMMIPGSMFIPFPVHIDPGALFLSRIDDGWKYFCADHGKAAASFPGLGSVIRNGDCVGARISLDRSCSEWVVDNSNYNSGWGTTIWSKSMTEQDAQKFKPVPTKTPFKVRQLQRIVFDGFYSGALHFTYEEFIDSHKESKQFIFDFSGKPTLISIKGNQLIVHSADNVKMSFEWKKIEKNI